MDDQLIIEIPPINAAPLKRSAKEIIQIFKSIGRSLRREGREIDRFFSRFQRGLRGLSTQGLNRVTAGLRELNRQARVTSGNFNGAFRAVRRFDGQTQRTGTTLRSATAAARGFAGANRILGSSTLAALFGMISLTTAVLAFTRAVRAGIRSSIDYEKSLADIGRIGRLTRASLKGLNILFRDLSDSLGAGRDELARFAVEGARFGIREPKELAEFAALAVQLARIDPAFENLALVRSLIRIRELSPGANRSLSELSNQLVALAETLPITSGELAEIASRLSQEIGPLFNTTTDFVTALGATLRAAGIQSERAGTAIARVFRATRDAIRENGPVLEQLAALSGLTREEFIKLANSNPQEVFKLLTQDLETSIVALDALNLTGVRVRSVIEGLGANAGKFAANLKLATKAAEDNNRIANATNITLQTTFGILKQVGAAFKEVFVDIFTATGGRFNAVIRDIRDFALALRGTGQAGREAASRLPAVAALGESIRRFAEAAGFAFKEFISFISGSGASVIAGLVDALTAMATTLGVTIRLLSIFVSQFEPDTIRSFTKNLALLAFAAAAVGAAISVVAGTIVSLGVAIIAAEAAVPIITTVFAAIAAGAGTAAAAVVVVTASVIALVAAFKAASNLKDTLRLTDERGASADIFRQSKDLDFGAVRAQRQAAAAELKALAEGGASDTQIQARADELEAAINKFATQRFRAITSSVVNQGDFNAAEIAELSQDAQGLSNIIGRTDRFLKKTVESFKRTEASSADIANAADAAAAAAAAAAKTNERVAAARAIASAALQKSLDIFVQRQLAGITGGAGATVAERIKASLFKVVEQITRSFAKRDAAGNLIGTLTGPQIADAARQIVGAQLKLQEAAIANITAPIIPAVTDFGSAVENTLQQSATQQLRQSELELLEENNEILEDQLKKLKDIDKKIQPSQIIDLLS